MWLRSQGPGGDAVPQPVGQTGGRGAWTLGRCPPSTRDCTGLQVKGSPQQRLSHRGWGTFSSQNKEVGDHHPRASAGVRIPQSPRLAVSPSGRVPLSEALRPLGHSWPPEAAPFYVSSSHSRKDDGSSRRNGKAPKSESKLFSDAPNSPTPRSFFDPHPSVCSLLI